MGTSSSKKRTMVERDNRLELNDNTSARVVILRGAGATPPEVHGTLENLSAGGVGLCLDDCVPCGESATLRIIFEDTAGNQDGELALDIKVRRSRPTADGNWTTGCDCKTKLPEEVFAMFADRGEIERRRASRLPTQLVAMSRWELSLDERPIEITDASQEGFTFRSAKMGSAGDRLMVWLTTSDGEEVTIPAQLQWKAGSDSGYLGGCQLVRKKDHCHLMPFAIEDKFDNTLRDRSPSDGNPVEGPSKMAFAAAVFLLFAGPSIVVLPLLHANRHAQALTVVNEEPNAATAERSPVGVDSEPPLSDETIAKVASIPARPETTDVPAPVAPRPVVPESLPDEAEDTDKEPPLVDEQPTTFAPIPSAVEPIPDHPSFDEPGVPNTAAPADAPGVDPLSHDYSILGDNAPLEPALEQPSISEAIRIAEPAIVTLQEAIGLSTFIAPDEVDPDAAWPATPELLFPEPTVREPVAERRVITLAARRRATAEFNRGREALATGNTKDALTAFAEATAANPEAALYQYHWALALHTAGEPEAAIVRMAEAAILEREHGLTGWGQVMQRIQGRPRVWLERTRRQALADD